MISTRVFLAALAGLSGLAEILSAGTAPAAAQVRDRADAGVWTEQVGSASPRIGVLTPRQRSGAAAQRGAGAPLSTPAAMEDQS